MSAETLRDFPDERRIDGAWIETGGYLSAAERALMSKATEQYPMSFEEIDHA